jgi:hypothetical protein
VKQWNTQNRRRAGNKKERDDATGIKTWMEIQSRDRALPASACPSAAQEASQPASRSATFGCIKHLAEAACRWRWKGEQDHIAREGGADWSKGLVPGVGLRN